MDILTKVERSALMARVRSKDTKPEIAVRSLVHRMGFRFRLHLRDLPGVPDLVFPARRRIVLVHGCFWHGHSCRAGKNRPVSHSEYWNAKLERNMTRDRRNIARLRRDGWGVLTVWECQVSSAALPLRLKKFLESK